MSESTSGAPRLYYDLGSPYSWLAFERLDRSRKGKFQLEPILIGGIFLLRGSGSWSQTETRAANIGEIERRAAEYGLGKVDWPENWPDNTLRAMRCAIWAENQSQLTEFTRVAFRLAFRSGEDLSDQLVLASVAQDCGLDPDRMLSAIDTDSVKDELRSRTDRAWELGVKGAPTLIHGDELFYGDDKLEAALGEL